MCRCRVPSLNRSLPARGPATVSRAMVVGNRVFPLLIVESNRIFVADASLGTLSRTAGARRSVEFAISARGRRGIGYEVDAAVVGQLQVEQAVGTRLRAPEEETRAARAREVRAPSRPRGPGHLRHGRRGGQRTQLQHTSVSPAGGRGCARRPGRPVVPVVGGDVRDELHGAHGLVTPRSSKRPPSLEVPSMVAAPPAAHLDERRPRGGCRASGRSRRWMAQVEDELDVLDVAPRGLDSHLVLGQPAGTTTCRPRGGR